MTPEKQAVHDAIAALYAADLYGARPFVLRCLVDARPTRPTIGAVIDSYLEDQGYTRSEVFTRSRCLLLSRLRIDTYRHLASFVTPSGVRLWCNSEIARALGKHPSTVSRAVAA